MLPTRTTARGHALDKWQDTPKIYRRTWENKLSIIALPPPVTPLVSLIVLLIALAGLVAAYVLAPLWTQQRTPRAAPEEMREHNLEVLRERLGELDHSIPDESPERSAALVELAAQARFELTPSASPAAPWLGDHSSHPPTRRRPALAAVLMFLMVGASGGLYLLAGAPDALIAAPRADLASDSPESTIAAVRDPSDAEAWLARGQAELARGAPQAAERALERALTLAPEAPQIKIDLADALGQLQGTRLDGRPIALIREALESAPKHPKALALAGVYAVSQQNFPEALRLWRELLDVLPPGSPQAQQIAGFIADLTAGQPPRIREESAAQTNSDTAPTKPSTQDSMYQRSALSGTVSLAPSLKSLLNPQSSLFIVARTLDEHGVAFGPPVAVFKGTGADLPLAFTLDDRHAMTPTGRLSSLESNVPLQVIARVSRQGQASAQSGDLQGRSTPVTAGSVGMRILIDTVID